MKDRLVSTSQEGLFNINIRWKEIFSKIEMKLTLCICFELLKISYVQAEQLFLHWGRDGGNIGSKNETSHFSNESKTQELNSVWLYIQSLI